VSAVLMEIPRVRVEAGDLSDAVAFVSSAPDAWIGNVALVFTGYDDDLRELWEVPEVRRWFAGFVAEVPHLLMFLSPEFGSTKLYFALLLPQLDNAHVIPALQDAFAAMNEYVDAHGIDPDRVDVASLPDRIVRSLGS
jgi:hypothetical protein